MSDEYKDSHEQQAAPIQVDGFGIKGSISPNAVESTPETWLKVWKCVEKSLRGVVTHAFGLIADALQACRSLVRGVGGFPNAVNQRITNGRVLAIRIEEAAQMKPAPAQLTEGEA